MSDYDKFILNPVGTPHASISSNHTVHSWNFPAGTDISTPMGWIRFRSQSTDALYSVATITRLSLDGRYHSIFSQQRAVVMKGWSFKASWGKQKVRFQTLHIMHILIQLAEYNITDIDVRPFSYKINRRFLASSTISWPTAGPSTGHAHRPLSLL